MKIFYKQKSKLDFFILNLLFYFKCILESGLPSKHSSLLQKLKAHLFLIAKSHQLMHEIF